MAEVFRRREGGKYYGTYFDEKGKRKQRSTGCRDKRAAELILRQWETEAAKRRSGLIDMNAEKYRTESLRPFEDHIRDFGRHLRTGGTGAKHVERTAEVLRRIAAHAKFQTLADLTADGVTDYAVCLADQTTRFGTRTAPRTVHAHLTAAKSFTSWLTKGGKLVRDPLAGVRKPNPKRRKRRRILRHEEWPTLANSVRSAGVEFGLTGEERWMLYYCAVATGYRAKELRSLRRGDLRRRDGRWMLDAVPGRRRSEERRRRLARSPRRPGRRAEGEPRSQPRPPPASGRTGPHLRGQNARTGSGGRPPGSG